MPKNRDTAAQSPPISTTAQQETSTTTLHKIGKVTYAVISSHSATATYSMTQKIERLIMKNLYNDLRQDSHSDSRQELQPDSRQDSRKDSRQK